MQSLSQCRTKFLTVLCELSEPNAQLSAHQLYDRRGMSLPTRTDQKFLSLALSSLWKLIPGLTGLSYKLDAVVFTCLSQNQAAWWSESYPPALPVCRAVSGHLPYFLEGFSRTASGTIDAVMSSNTTDGSFPAPKTSLAPRISIPTSFSPLPILRAISSFNRTVRLVLAFDQTNVEGVNFGIVANSHGSPARQTHFA